jgi:hypothetical protein
MVSHQAEWEIIMLLPQQKDIKIQVINKKYKYKEEQAELSLPASLHTPAVTFKEEELEQNMPMKWSQAVTEEEDPVQEKLVVML